AVPRRARPRAPCARRGPSRDVALQEQPGIPARLAREARRGPNLDLGGPRSAPTPARPAPRGHAPIPAQRRRPARGPGRSRRRRGAATRGPRGPSRVVGRRALVGPPDPRLARRALPAGRPPRRGGRPPARRPPRRRRILTSLARPTPRTHPSPHPPLRRLEPHPSRPLAQRTRPPNAHRRAVNPNPLNSRSAPRVSPTPP